jgi:hypothetical protein
MSKRGVVRGSCPMGSDRRTGMRSLIPAAKHRSAHCKRRRIQQPDQHIAACLLLGGTGKAAQAASQSSTSFEDTVVRCAVHLMNSDMNCEFGKAQGARDIQAFQLHGASSWHGNDHDLVEPKQAESRRFTASLPHTARAKPWTSCGPARSLRERAEPA